MDVILEGKYCWLDDESVGGAMFSEDRVIKN
jgi:hypothetical protein